MTPHHWWLRFLTTFGACRTRSCQQIKAWRGKFFVFLTNRDVPATNNISEREIRPSVVFRKVTNGFRPDWGAQIHAGYRSVTRTARLSGKSALGAIRDLVDGNFVTARLLPRLVVLDGLDDVWIVDDGMKKVVPFFG